MSFQVKDLPTELLPDEFLRERLKNNPFNKHVIFYDILKGNNTYEIRYVNELIKGIGYEIFESWGTENIYTFLDNIYIYHYDKYHTLKYLYNYTDDDGNTPFKQTLQNLFNVNEDQTILLEKLTKYKQKLKTTEVKIQRRLYGKLKDEMVNLKLDVKDIKEEIKRIHRKLDKFPSHLTNISGDILINFDEKVEFEYLPIIKVNTFGIDYSYTGMLGRPISFFLKNVVEPKVHVHEMDEYFGIGDLIRVYKFLEPFMNIKRHRDYILTTMFIFTGYYIESKEDYEMGNFITDLKHRSNIESSDNEFFQIIFYVLYHNQIWPQIDINVDIELVEYAAGLKSKRKFLVPPYLQSLQYNNEHYIPTEKRLSIGTIKEKDDDYIDPNKVLLKVGLLNYDYKKKVLLQSIFSSLFIKTDYVLRKQKRDLINYYYYEHKPLFESEDEQMELLEKFKTMNPKLEDMFIKGNLDPAPFISGIRLFNELYTIKYIFKFIVENPKGGVFFRELDEHLEMLIFTSKTERDTFTLNFKDAFITNKMTRDELDQYKKWPVRTFVPIILPPTSPHPVFFFGL